MIYQPECESESDCLYMQLRHEKLTYFFLYLLLFKITIVTATMQTIKIRPTAAATSIPIILGVKKFSPLTAPVPGATGNQ